jgi:fibronectin-binding autotransporter adhesin
MKPKYRIAGFPPLSARLVMSLGLMATGVSLQSAHAVSYYWNTTTTGLWSDGTNWSDNATSGGTTGVVPTTADTTVFNQSSVNGAEIVQFNADASITGVTFANTGTTLLQSDSATARTLTLGGSGITLNSGAGAVTLGNSTNTLNLALSASQSWTNNSSNLLTVVNGVSSSTAGAKTLTIAGSGNTAISGNITNGSGTVALTKSGTGTLALSGVSNSIGGSLTVNAGIVDLSTDLGLAGGTLINGTGGTINATSGGRILLNAVGGDVGVTNGNTLTINSVIANGTQSSVDFYNTNNGTGVVVLTADNTFSGTTNIQGGVVSVSKIGDSGIAGNLGTNGTINFGVTNATTGTLRYTGTGETNNRVINLAGSTAGGTIDASGSGLLKFTSNLTAAAGSKVLTLQGSTTGEFAGNITNGSGTVGLTKAGTGTWTLSGASNSISGTLTVNAGILNLVTDLGLAGGTMINGNGGTINATGGGRILLNVAGGDFGVTNGNTLTVNAVIANGTQNSVDFWNTANGTGVVVLTADNTFSGTINLQSGVISVSKIGDNGVAGNLGTNGTLNFGVTNASSATLRYTGTGETNNRVINLAGTTAGATINQSGTGLLKFTGNLTATGAGSKTLTLQGSTAGAGELSGAIVDNSATNKTSLTKTGTGSWTLSGVNTYTGATAINAGTLAIEATGSLAAGSAVTVANTATLTNNGTIGGAVTVNTGGTLNGSGTFSGAVAVNGNLNPGNSPGSQTYAAGLTLGAATVTTMEIAGSGGVAGTDFDFINVTGGTMTNDGSLTIVDFGGYDISAQTGTYNLFDFLANTGDFDMVTVDGTSLTYNVGTDDWSATAGDASYNFAEGTGVLSVTVVPESTAALLGGLGLLGLLRRRRVA